MNMMTTVLLIIAGIGYVLYRQFTQQPVTLRSLLIPAGLAVVLASRYHDDTGVLSINILVFSACIGLAMGSGTGFFAQVWRDQVTGTLYARGGWAFVLTLFVLIALRICLRVVLQASGLPVSVAVLNDAVLVISVASYLGRVAIIGLRALALAGWDLAALDIPSGRRRQSQTAW